MRSYERFKALTICLLFFIVAATECDVLIHEGTMDDDLLEDAKQKRHSTVSQALDIGARMKARHVILTHFSQRYSKVPLIDHLPSNVIIAFDNMKVYHNITINITVTTVAYS